jgi:hypothetical protein
LQISDGNLQKSDFSDLVDVYISRLQSVHATDSLQELLSRTRNLHTLRKSLRLLTPQEHLPSVEELKKEAGHLEEETESSSALNATIQTVENVLESTFDGHLAVAYEIRTEFITRVRQVRLVLKLAGKLDKKSIDTKEAEKHFDDIIRSKKNAVPSSECLSTALDDLEKKLKEVEKKSPGTKKIFELLDKGHIQLATISDKDLKELKESSWGKALVLTIASDGRV